MILNDIKYVTSLGEIIVCVHYDDDVVVCLYRYCCSLLFWVKDPLESKDPWVTRRRSWVIVKSRVGTMTDTYRDISIKSIGKWGVLDLSPVGRYSRIHTFEKYRIVLFSNNLVLKSVPGRYHSEV
jgi:hypothetical protein